jgi:anti-anti-sigma factor
MKEGLIIEVDDRHPLAIVRLSGSLAAMEIYKVKAMADTWLREGKKFIALNLAYVNFMDSAGIGLLLQLRNSCHAAGGGVVLVRSATGQVMRTLEIASVEKLIPFFESIGDALGYLQTKYGVGAGQVVSSHPAGDLKEIVKLLGQRLTQVEERLARIESKLGK